MTDAASIDAAVGACATHIGLVLHQRSPRFVTVEAAARLAATARGRVGVVALVVDADDSLLRAIADAVRPDALQCHGGETPPRLSAVRDLVRPAAIWRARGVAGASDLADAVGDGADLRVFDARPPAGAARPGGHGAAFDWRLLARAPCDAPWIVAGGLTPETVADAIKAAAGAPGFAGVDVSSGVEVSPGVKDPQRIAAFVAAARRAFAACTPAAGRF